MLKKFRNSKRLIFIVCSSVRPNLSLRGQQESKRVIMDRLSIYSDYVLPSEPKILCLILEGARMLEQISKCHKTRKCVTCRFLPSLKCASATHPLLLLFIFVIQLQRFNVSHLYSYTRRESVIPRG